MQLTIAPFKKEHFCQIKPREPNLSMSKGLGDISRFAELYEHNPAISIFHGAEIVGSFGVVVLWPGVAEAWVYVGNEVENHKIEFHRIVKCLLNDVINNLKLRRVQAAIDANYEIGLAWAKRLGFSEEGKLHMFGVNGEDYIMCAKFNDI